MSFVSFFNWLECASCCVCFFVYYFSLSLVPLTRSYWCLEIVVCLSCKTIHKVSIWSLFCVFPWKSECFNLNNSLGYLPYSIHHHWTSWLSLSFQLADLLSLFILLSCFDVVSPLGVQPPSFWWHLERLET